MTASCEGRRFSRNSAQGQILGLLRQMERHRQDWATGKASRLDRESLWRHGKLFYGSQKLDWEEAWDKLLAEGLIVRKGEEYSLLEGLRPWADELRKAHLGEGFGKLQIRCAESPVYGEYCRRAFSSDLPVFSLVEEHQLDRIADLLAFRPPPRVLDLGCGVGTLTTALQERTGGIFTGVDLSTEAIDYARRRGSGEAMGNAPSLRFRQADLDSWQPPAGSFEAVLGIDVLYFLDHLALTLTRLLRVLPAGGQMIFLCSDLAEGAEDDSLPRTGRLFQALASLAVRVETWDFRTVEEGLWHRQKAAAESLRGAFEKEGNGDLGEMLLRESARGVRWVVAGRIRRYLYRVVKEVRSESAPLGEPDGSRDRY